MSLTNTSSASASASAFVVEIPTALPEDDEPSTVTEPAEPSNVKALRAKKPRATKTPKDTSGSVLKGHIAAAISQKKGVTKELATVVIDAFLEEVVSALAEGKVVHLPGFGKFHTLISKPRETPNPQRRDETVQVPSKMKAKFATFGALDKRLAESYTAAALLQSHSSEEAEIHDEK